MLPLNLTGGANGLFLKKKYFTLLFYGYLPPDI